MAGACTKVKTFHVVLLCHCFHCFDDDGSYGNRSQISPGDDFFSLKVEKLVSTLNVVDWAKVNCIDGSRMLGICRLMLVMSLTVGAKRYSTMFVVVNGCAVDNGMGTEILGDAIFWRKII